MPYFFVLPAFGIAVLMRFLVPVFAPGGVAGDPGAREVLGSALPAPGFTAGATFGFFLALRSLRSASGGRKDCARHA